MTDIVERLREGPGDWQQEAADEIERLRKENEELKHPRCDGDHAAEIDRLLQAIGMLTTLHPTMEIDILDPIGMAEQVVAHVTAEIERLRRLLQWYLDWVAGEEADEILTWEKRVREALGE